MDDIMQFHRRFAKGEQNLMMSPDGKIVKKEKDYYWQELEVYNHILPIIEIIKIKKPQIKDQELYGENGVVSRLVSVQRAYNNIKNRKHEYLRRLAIGVLVVEDGSTDIDILEEEGLAPGRVIVYRKEQYSPKLLNMNPDIVTVLDAQEDLLLKEFAYQAKAISNRYLCEDVMK